MGKAGSSKGEDFSEDLYRDAGSHPRGHDDIWLLEAIEWGPFLDGDAA
jgi:hypothetical protein